MWGCRALAAVRGGSSPAEQFDECVGRDDRAMVQPEHGEDYTRFGTRDRDRCSVLSDLERSANPQFHGLKRSHVPDRPGRYSTRGQDRVKAVERAGFPDGKPQLRQYPTPSRRRGPDSDYLHLVASLQGQMSETAKGFAVGPQPDDSATLQYRGGELELEIVHVTEGADGIALGPLLSKTAIRRSTTASSTRRPPKAPSPISTAMPASCAIAATRSSSWPRSRPSSRSATC